MYVCARAPVRRARAPVRPGTLRAALKAAEHTVSELRDRQCQTVVGNNGLTSRLNPELAVRPPQCPRVCGLMAGA